jgi:hypothetical protein
MFTRTVRGKSGARKIRSSKPVVEMLEDRTLLSISFSQPAHSGIVTMTGTPAGDQFMVQMKPNDPATIEFSDDGGFNFTDAALSGVTAVVVTGMAGKDSLTVNNDNGLVGRVDGLAITFTGGSGHDTLIVTGDTGATIIETYHGSKPGLAVLTLAAGTLYSEIGLKNVNHVFDTLKADQLFVDMNRRSDVIHVRDGQTMDGLVTNTIAGTDVSALDDGPGGAVGLGAIIDTTVFTPITFANKRQVLIGTQGGDDLFVVNVSHSATGLQSLFLAGGSGFNTLVARQMPPGVAVTLTLIQRTDGTTDSIFIDELYEERLGRAAADGELLAWEFLLHTPGGRAAVVRGIEESLEARLYFIRNLYRHYLGRDAVNGEEMGWAMALVNGETEEQILTAFLSSDEFYARAQTSVTTGTPDQRYITAIYQLLLNRQPTANELASWVNALATSGRAGVVQAFVESVEFRTEVIAAFYATLLWRDADAAALAAWAFSNMDLAKIREAFLASDEAFLNG